MDPQPGNRVPCSCRACVRAKLCASYPRGPGLATVPRPAAPAARAGAARVVLWLSRGSPVVVPWVVPWMFRDCPVDCPVGCPVVVPWLSRGGPVVVIGRT